MDAAIAAAKKAREAAAAASVNATSKSISAAVLRKIAKLSKETVAARTNAEGADAEENEHTLHFRFL